jgi:hypothetical protein
MKNTHLDHPEDSILTGDLSVLDWFVNPGTLSVKIDGAPAIVFGTNPATGKFFVGTKVRIQQSQNQNLLYSWRMCLLCIGEQPALVEILSGMF